MRHNLRTLFGVSQAPCDTQMRAILDPVEPGALRPAFRALHSAVQRGGALADYGYLDDAYLLSLDGTGQFASSRVSCEHCCEKHTKGGVAVSVVSRPIARFSAFDEKDTALNTTATVAGGFALH